MLCCGTASGRGCAAAAQREAGSGVGGVAGLGVGGFGVGRERLAAIGVDMEALSDDSGWSSLDDSDIEEFLQDDDVEMMGLLLDMQEFEDRAKLMDQRRGSKMGRVTIYRNRGLGHEHLMHDYFVEVPTYPPRLFHRRYRMRRSLFVKIVTDCEVASDYFKRHISVVGIMGFSGYQKISIRNCDMSNDSFKGWGCGKD
ncbi:ATP-dependent zinc metalloprotease FTSH 5, mitochondrial [Hordeum vulgare]|nr:ATP-dependent zinc metalloprotease FTSH 5, mitochondrial [Hordeum vulgare]